MSRVAIFLILLSVGGRLDAGWIRSFTRNRSVGSTRFFLATEFRANHFAAADYCRRIGMNLATVASSDEQVELERLLDQSDAIISKTVSLHNSFSNMFGVEAEMDGDNDVSSYQVDQDLSPLIAFSYEDVWLSATDLAQRSRFVWSSTGEKLAYTNWAVGEPSKQNTSDEHCLHASFRNGEGWVWKAASCDEQKYFACEYTGIV